MFKIKKKMGGARGKYLVDKMCRQSFSGETWGKETTGKTQLWMTWYYHVSSGNRMEVVDWIVKV
jgi:hypothetical protein